MSLVSSCRRPSLVAAAVIAAIGASAAPAPASGTATCPAVPTSNPFARWGDNAQYQLAPGGSVERAAAGWSLTGGAAVAEGNETFMVTGPRDHLSMLLPSGASATNARMCVGVEHPTFRFFAKRSSGPASSTLAVDVVYTDAAGRERSLRAGTISGSDAWAPSPVLPTMAEQIGATPDDTVEISFRFKSQAGATWSIDDLYVDPHKIP